MLRFIFTLLFISSAPNAQAAEHPKTSELSQAPIEAYTSLPLVSQVDLSPNGTHLAFVQNYQGTLVLNITNLKTQETLPVLKSDNKEVTLNWYDWANNNTLIVAAGYTQRQRLLKYHSTQLFKFDLNGTKKLENLLPIRNRNVKNAAQFQDNVISMLPNDPKHILVAVDFDTVNRPSVFKVNVDTKRRERILRPRRNISDWIADRQGNVRIGYKLKDTTISYILYDRDKNSLHNKPLYQFDVFSPERVTILGFGQDGDTLYIKANHEGKNALFKTKVSQPQNRELIFSDPDYDVDGTILYSQITGKVNGFSHSNTERSRIYWDEEYKSLQTALSSALPNAHNVIIDKSQDGDTYVLYSSSNTDSGTYYLGQRKAQSLYLFAPQYPEIQDATYLGKQRHRYKARDGLTIEGYLTLPPGDRSNSVPYPTIILPHGGPMARDYADFDYWSELFASRGYAVFQPNFRGSYGYGYEFAQAAMGAWGEAMQNDLQDAAHYLIEQKIANKDQICVGGGSYGGYAAVMAVVKHPDTFKCAASFAGVMDLESIVSRARYYTNREVVEKQFGDDDNKLESNSPINNIAAIKRPILLIHGEDDKVVPVSHSRRMYDDLLDAKKAVKYIELESGNHHLSYQAHRHTTLTAFLSFFDTHLKAK
ncbi:alpha/beta hydrolase family protein [Pseudoalteromonas aurantia]|uniref:S9 family peptidase n=1 Tax=Pseudoalteromonas aurantia TaxID=43654 RepID=A0ABY2W2S8_9GAMM|nr:alpha/beta fold hydrolase [Pseudoalteromonas aurantia]TMO67695.1 S9 family peptidase [Pseudoalteromonas aurantia]TMO78946.1 S9 family peptidase [Pseudoalteromonas aurantia]